VKHARLEKIRNPALVLEAKRLFKGSHGILKCQVCDFDFEAAYGDRGKDYIEVHHTTPISQIENATKLTVDDVRMVCSNCHRMLHRPPWIAVEELKTAMHSAGLT
jgi:putative restriction endonuclease